MAYIELYKKYRPRTWSEVIGQNDVVKSLQYAVKNDKIPTGYLLAGPPGTGKTTLGLILAKAVNCPNVDEDGNPCNQCDICKSIDNNSQIGIKYISMANNGSAEDIRRIMEESRMAQPIKKKVFILDEVHNLSSAAQDAMLIGLESENQSTLFICCTTDPNKVKPAIISRLQMRSLKRVDTKLLAENLINIIKHEPDLTKLAKDDIITKENVIQCAKMANGSVRNSITNLEAIVSSGVLPTEYSKQVIDDIINKDVVKVINTLDKMSDESVDFVRAGEQVYENFSEMLKIKTGCTSSDDTLTDMAKKCSGNFILEALKRVGHTLTLVANKTVDYKILFEICYTELALIKRKEDNKKAN